MDVEPLISTLAEELRKGWGRGGGDYKDSWHNIRGREVDGQSKLCDFSLHSMLAVVRIGSSRGTGSVIVWISRSTWCEQITWGSPIRIGNHRLRGKGRMRRDIGIALA